MGAKSFQTSRIHLEIIDVRNMTRRKFYVEFSPILKATVQSLFTIGTWHRLLYTPACLFQFFLESPKPSEPAQEPTPGPNQWATGVFSGGQMAGARS